MATKTTPAPTMGMATMSRCRALEHARRCCCCWFLSASVAAGGVFAELFIGPERATFWRGAILELSAAHILDALKSVPPVVVWSPLVLTALGFAAAWYAYILREGPGRAPLHAGRWGVPLQQVVFRRDLPLHLRAWLPEALLKTCSGRAAQGPDRRPGSLMAPRRMPARRQGHRPGCRPATSITTPSPLHGDRRPAVLRALGLLAMTGILSSPPSCP